MEKRVVYRIYCNEFYNENEELTVQFICGTAFLKKHESEKDIDIYGCSFNAKEKRLLKIGKYVEFKNNVSEEELELPINIAVKKAECIKLNKEEQKDFYGTMADAGGLRLFLQIFLIAGGLFGIGMALTCLIICVVIGTIFGLFSYIPEMLKEIPWGLILAIVWIGFGGAMAIIELLVKRK